MVFALSGFTMSKDYGQIKARTISKIKLPKLYHEGLYSDGKDIWVNNGKKGDTWVVDTDSGKITRKIKQAGSFTEAITSKDKDIYVTQNVEDALARANSLAGEEDLILITGSLFVVGEAGQIVHG